MKRTSITPADRKGSPRERWNWMTPMFVSRHQPRRVYCGSQNVWVSEDRGDHWRCISPDLTTDDAAKQQGNVPHCTLTMIAESPLRADVLWAGSDDGRLHITRNGGGAWQDVSAALPTEARGLWIARIVASAHEAGRAYVAVNGYREDRFAPLLYVTEDFGGTFSPLSAGLPQQPVNCVAEDAVNPDLLFVAHDRGVCVSEDRGGSWATLGTKLPPVPVHDLAIQSRDRDLVAGTHGRGIYVADITPLRHFGPSKAGTAQVAPPKLVLPPPAQLGRADRGARFFAVPNGKVGAFCWVHLPSVPEGDVSLVIDSASGTELRNLTVKKQAGAQMVLWDLTGVTQRGSAAARGAAAGRGRDAPRPRRLAAGDYVLRLVSGDKELARTLVTLPPQVATSALPSADSETTEAAEEVEPAASGEGHAAGVR